MDKFDLVRFTDNDFELDVRADSENETVWLTQDEITFLFERDKSVISRHIRNIFVEGELEKDRVVAKNATTASGGKTYEVIFYNLDVVISVGYRVKSQRGILFRKWANKVLKESETKRNYNYGSWSEFIEAEEIK